MISIEKHQELGKLLKEIRVELIEAKQQYKLKKNLYSSKETKALKHLDKFKCLMDDILIKDYPDNNNVFLCGIYYGEK